MEWFTTGDGNEGWSWSKRNAGCDTRVAPENIKTEISSNRLDPGSDYIFQVLSPVLQKTFLWHAYNDDECKETVRSKRFAPFLIGGPVRYTERILVSITNLDSQQYNQYYEPVAHSSTVNVRNMQQWQIY